MSSPRRPIRPLPWCMAGPLFAGILALFATRAAALDEPIDPELLAKVQEEQTVRVIVELDVPFDPEFADAHERRIAISHAQGIVVHSLAGHVAVVRRFRFIPFLALDVDEQGLLRLPSMPLVVSVNEDRMRRASLAASTPLIGATRAAAAGFTGRNWTVAILDTGVDTRHPFLKGRTVSEACYSGGRKRDRVKTVCPNHQVQQLGPGAGVNCSVNGCDHGTHVAGIAAGKGVAFSGVARDATIIAIQVFSRVNNAKRCKPDPAPCVTALDDNILAGLERVFELRKKFDIAAANLSLGGGQFATQAACDKADPAYKKIIAALNGAQIATVVAAGNESFRNALASPACISGAVSVGSTDIKDAVAASSNSAPFLSLLAPGVDINSSIPGGKFARFSGTSMAAPHVAGAWAVMKSSANFRKATVAVILARLQNTGKNVRDPKSKVTTPRIQLDAALGLRRVAAPPKVASTSLPRIVIDKLATDDDSPEANRRIFMWSSGRDPTWGDPFASTGMRARFENGTGYDTRRSSITLVQ